MSDASSRKQAVPKYFIKTPERPNDNSTGIVLLVVGAIALVLGLLMMMSNSEAICMGMLLLLAGGAMVFYGWGAYANNAAALKKYNEDYAKAEPKPTDSQMDAWLQADIKRLKVEALKKLDLGEEQLLQPEPLLIVGPADKTALAVGKDGIIRFSVYDIVFIYLTNYHLAAYEGTLDMATGNTVSESTQEYHYTDVVSVATQTGNLFNIVINGENKSIDTYQKFALAVASGDHIDVVVAFPHRDQLKEFLSTGEFPPSGAEEAIRSIRARLREKKGGVPV
jgi:hypothetical protein